ncbi:hypothetical protein ACWIUH_11730 [Ursidibacter arcticus]
MNNKTSPSLPPRKWYTLEQAVKRINKLTGEEIEVADLLHFAINKKIQFCVRFIYAENLFLIIGNNFIDLSENKVLKKIPKGMDNDFIKEIDMFNFLMSLDFEMIDNCDILKKINYIEIEQFDYKCFKGLVSLVAQMTLKDYSLFELELKEKFFKVNKTIFSSPLINNQELAFFKFFCDNSFYISKNDLLILNEDIEKFINGKSILDKSIHKKIFDDSVEIELEEKEYSSTIKENQINFIKGLLYLHYGIESPQDAKNAINTGKLGQDIARLKRENPNIEQEKNFKFPSSTGLFNWYNRT